MAATQVKRYIQQMGGEGSGGNMKGHLVERLYRQCSEVDGCLVWQGRRNADGYGVIIHQGVELLTHRAAWRIIFGEPLPAMVCHRCDNPPCIKAAHLFSGDAAINKADSVAKNRQARGHIIAKKLWDADIPEIRAAVAQGETLASIARKYGVTQATIGNVRDGRTWRHIPHRTPPES